MTKYTLIHKHTNNPQTVRIKKKKENDTLSWNREKKKLKCSIYLHSPTNTSCELCLQIYNEQKFCMWTYFTLYGLLPMCIVCFGVPHPAGSYFSEADTYHYCAKYPFSKLHQLKCTTILSQELSWRPQSAELQICYIQCLYIPTIFHQYHSVTSYQQQKNIRYSSFFHYCSSKIQLLTIRTIRYTHTCYLPFLHKYRPVTNYK